MKPLRPTFVVAAVVAAAFLWHLLLLDGVEVRLAPVHEALSGLHAQVDSLQRAVAQQPADYRRERDSLVARVARELGLSPALALAVAWVENRGADSIAVSSAGAVGLMQVMPPDALAARGNPAAAPARAALIAEVCGAEWRLFERECNVRVGLRIFQDMLILHGDEDRALAAYNGALLLPVAASRYVTAVRRYVTALEGT